MKRLYWGIVSLTMLIVATLNIMAWNSKKLCDWYIMNIFPIWGKTYGRLTAMSSRSVGEIMIALALVLVALALALGLVAVFFVIVIKLRHGRVSESQYIHFFSIYMHTLGGIAVFTMLVMTLNCYMLYHGSRFEEKYLDEYLIGEREYTVEELGQLRDFVVTKANEYSKLVERDENGAIIYDGDMQATAIAAMQSLAEDYPQLQGYYTTPKPFAASEFFSQQYMKGYYFPFSMEANYNDVMYIVSIPATMCHELSHTKGFIYEDEANMLSFLACVHSDDPLFVYSGYMSVLNYIDNDFKKSINYDKMTYNSHVRLRKRVMLDNVFLTEDAWEKVEEKAVMKTDTVKKASHKFVETNLKANGIEEGSAIYCEVVGLMMDYYVCGIDDELNQNVYLAQMAEK